MLTTTLILWVIANLWLIASFVHPRNRYLQVGVLISAAQFAFALTLTLR